MYNNDVTYADKWDTPENRAALEKLERKFFNRSECSPDCPVSWAPEVLELMELLHKELGFRRNESTMRGYYIQGNMLDWFVKDPWKGLFYSFKRNVFEKPKDGKTVDRQRVYSSRPLHKRIKNMFESFTHPFGYGIRALTIRYVNPVLNRWEKNRISLGQLKEKYGMLTCYFHSSDAFQEYIEQEVRKCEIKLALKGCYYPIESFWDSRSRYSVGTEYRPDIIETKVDPKDGTIDVTKTTYRQAMKDLGLNLEEIKQKAELAKAQKANQP